MYLNFSNVFNEKIEKFELYVLFTLVVLRPNAYDEIRFKCISIFIIFMKLCCECYERFTSVLKNSLDDKKSKQVNKNKLRSVIVS